MFTVAAQANTCSNWGLVARCSYAPGRWRGKDNEQFDSVQQCRWIAQCMAPMVNNRDQASTFAQLLKCSGMAAIYTATAGKEMLPVTRVFDVIIIAESDIYGGSMRPTLAQIVIAALMANPKSRVICCIDDVSKYVMVLAMFRRLMTQVQLVDCPYVMIRSHQYWQWRMFRLVIDQKQPDGFLTEPECTLYGSESICSGTTMAVHLASRFADKHVLLVGNRLQLLYECIGMCGRELRELFSRPRRHVHCCLACNDAAAGGEEILRAWRMPYVYVDLNIFIVSMHHRFRHTIYAGNDPDALLLLCLLATASGMVNGSGYRGKHSRTCARWTPTLPNAVEYVVDVLDGACPCSGQDSGGQMLAAMRMPPVVTMRRPKSTVYVGTTRWVSGHVVPRLRYTATCTLLSVDNPLQWSADNYSAFEHDLQRLQWLIYYCMNAHRGIAVESPTSDTITRLIYT